MVARLVVDADFVGVEVRNAVKRLRELDPDMNKFLRKELRTDVKPFAQKAAAAFPTTPPLSGLGYPSRTMWGTMSGGVSFTTARRKGGGVTSLVAIAVKTKERVAGPNMAELAGMRGNKTTQGASLIRNLKDAGYPLAGKGGRFAWRYFMGVKGQLNDIGRADVQKFIDAVNLEG